MIIAIIPRLTALTGELRKSHSDRGTIITAFATIHQLLLKLPVEVNIVLSVLFYHQVPTRGSLFVRWLLIA